MIFEKTNGKVSRLKREKTLNLIILHSKISINDNENAYF